MKLIEVNEENSGRPRMETCVHYYRLSKMEDYNDFSKVQNAICCKYNNKQKEMELHDNPK